MATDLYLGIDSGGSKTAGVLLDAGGRVLARGRAGGSAIVGEPSEKALAVLAGLLDALCGEAGATPADIAHFGIGQNGIDFEDEIPAQRQATAKALAIPAERITLVNDGIVALWGATPAPAATVFQHGSGKTSAYRADHGGETLFDNLDAGQTFDLRHALVPLVARMIDGRAEPAALMDAVLEHFGVAAEDYAEAIFRGHIDWPQRASVAPLIFQACENGDAAAESLVARAIEDYAVAAAAMITKTGRDDADAAFGGGVINQAGPAFWQRLTDRVHELKPRANVLHVQLPPEYGSGIMAAFHGGAEPAELFRKLRDAYEGSADD